MIIAVGYYIANHVLTRDKLVGFFYGTLKIQEIITLKLLREHKSVLYVFFWLNFS
jgi:hypothetical protein